MLCIALKAPAGNIPFKKNDTGDSSRTETWLCDTIYKNKDYKLSLYTFDTENDDDTRSNCILNLSQVKDGHDVVLLRDSLYSKTGTFRFEDFNKDGVRDILLQNISDVRSNETYYLYLADTLHNRFKKIKGFEAIKNPHYIPEYDLVDNYVLSGRNWTSFYKIQAGHIKDYGILIYEGDSPEAQLQYDKDYKKAISSIRTRGRKKR
jgi:hypothetical protein